MNKLLKWKWLLVVVYDAIKYVLNHLQEWTSENEPKIGEDEKKV